MIPRKTGTGKQRYGGFPAETSEPAGNHFLTRYRPGAKPAGRAARYRTKIP